MVEPRGVALHDNPAMVNDESDKVGTNNKKDDHHGGFESATTDSFVLFSPDSLDRKQQHNAKVTRQYGFLPQQEPTISDGSVLPERFEPVPVFFLNKPIEEIENGVTEQTFCVLSRKFGKTYVHRFPAAKSCFALGMTNPIRKFCIGAVTNQYFVYLIMLTIIANCIYYIFGLDENFDPAATIIFLVIYVTEMFFKSFAYGFAFGKYTYLRNPWNWLDFLINIEQFASIFVDMGDVTVLRMFRLFRILSHFQGYRPIFGTLSRFTKMFFQIMSLTVFCLSILALVGSDTFRQSFKTKCSHHSDYNDTEGHEINKNEDCLENCGTFWEVYSSLNHTCGFGSGAYHCKENTTCVENAGPNPNFGYTSFDNFGSAMVTTFQIISLNSWNDVFDEVVFSNGPYGIIFFILFIFLGTFYLLNLVLAGIVFSCVRELKSHQSIPKICEIDGNIGEASATGNKSTTGLVSEAQLLPDHNCTCCSCCCIRYNLWLRCQRFIERIVTNCFVEYFFIACIVANTLIMAMDHHLMSMEFEKFLRTANYVFISVFIIEITLKIIAFSRDFFKDSWNVFDFFIILCGALDLALENISGLSVLRAIRILRILKLSRIAETGQPRTPMNVVRLVVGKTMSFSNYIAFVLTISAIIFGVLGRESIGRSYDHMEIANQSVPRHHEVTERLHFLDSAHAVYLIFRVMFGDWIEPLTDCLKGLGGYTCGFIIFPALIFGKFLLLNVFLAFTITAFHWKGKSSDNKQDETTQSCCTKGCLWVMNAIRTCCSHPILSPIPEEKSKFRRKMNKMIDHRFFQWGILILVIINCAVLCLENIHLKDNVALQTAITVFNGIFCAVYIFETIGKLLGHGFHQYFCSGSTIIELIITVSVLLNVTQAVRTEWTVLRAMVALRLTSRWPAIKVIAAILLSTIPSMLYVALISLIFWIIFAIVGVQFFGGRFFYCVDFNSRRPHPYEIPDRMDCVEVMNYTWTNADLNFDNVLNAFTSLIHVVTFQNWEDVTSSAVDAQLTFQAQPVTDNNVHMYAYFFSFLLCGAFYPFFLFVGIIIEKFNQLAKKQEGGIMKVFLSERWRSYLSNIATPDGKPLERPSSKFRAFCYDLALNIRLEVFMFVIIFLNMICMIVQSYSSHPHVFYIYGVMNLVFCCVLVVEAAIKIAGMRRGYFKIGWNVFDFLVVIFAILDILLVEFTSHGPGMEGIARMLRLVRLFRVFRIARVERVLSGGKFLSVIEKSFLAHLTLSALLFLIMFVYSVMGMLLFSHVKHTGVLNDVINFDTVGDSMVLLFRLFSSGGWSDVLQSLRVEPPFCDAAYDDGTTDCGPKCPVLSILFFASYIIINFMIITIYTAVILHNFNDVFQQGVAVNYIDAFFITWTKYDPTASQYISIWELPSFLHNLDLPLRIAKPNGTLIASFALPIATGSVVHCSDVLNELVKNNLGNDDESEDYPKLQGLMKRVFKKYFPIRKELEQDAAAQEWNKEDLAAYLDQNTRKHPQHTTGMETISLA